MEKQKLEEWIKDFALTHIFHRHEKEMVPLTSLPDQTSEFIWTLNKQYRLEIRENDWMLFEFQKYNDETVKLILGYKED